METEIKEGKKYISKPVYFYRQDLSILQKIELEGENYQLLIKALLNQWKSEDKTYIKGNKVTSELLIKNFIKYLSFKTLPNTNGEIITLLNPKDSSKCYFYPDYFIKEQDDKNVKYYYKDLMILDKKLISTLKIV